MKLEWKILGSRVDPNRAEDDLGQGINQRVERVLSSLKLRGLLAVRREHHGPHPEAEDELPVVHSGLCLLGFCRDSIPEVNGQLPHVNEGVLIAGVEVQPIDLHHTVGHEVDHWEVHCVHGL